MNHVAASNSVHNALLSAVTAIIAEAHPIYLASGLSDRRVTDAVELSISGSSIEEHLLSELSDAAINTGRLGEQEEDDARRMKYLRASDAVEAIHLALTSLHDLAEAYEALESARS